MSEPAAGLIPGPPTDDELRTFQLRSIGFRVPALRTLCELRLLRAVHARAQRYVDQLDALRGSLPGSPALGAAAARVYLDFERDLRALLKEHEVRAPEFHVQPTETDSALTAESLTPEPRHTLRDDL